MKNNMTFTQKKVIAIDDSPINLKLMQSVLEREGYLVLTHTDSTDVVDLIKREKPALILMDVMMPEIDGLSLLQSLGYEEETADIPVVMVSAKTTGKDLKDALELGAFDYLKKPIDELELIARVQAALRYKIQRDNLRDLAVRDSLTGLYNHGLLMELLAKEMYNQSRENFSLAFVMLDIDHFKEINDTYGHQAGDFILQGISEILTNTFRLGDSIARYGGEEFAVILPRVDRSTALTLGERIRQKISSHNFHFEGKKIQVSASFGIVIHHEDGSLDGGALVKKADMALFTAKKEGRNRVVLVEEGTKR